jgi:hypothetical protein
MITKNKLFKLFSFLSLLIGFNTLTQGQQKSNFSLLLGANINNPHQLIENSNNPNDVIGVYNTQKPFGNLWIGISFKNKIQIGLENEIPVSNGKLRINNNDTYLSCRYYFLKNKIQPYVNGAILINSYGDNTVTIKNLSGYQYGLGLIIKINKIVYFDLALNNTNKKIDYIDRLNPTLPENIINLSIDRFMIRTGLIFKVL